MQLQTYKDK